MTTILAVDDSATIRRCFEITFENTDYTLVTCDSAEAALEKVKTASPSVVIADASLPGSDGYELCSTIKLAAPSLPVLIMSSKQSPFDEAKGGDADAHLDKPFDTQTLRDKVAELIAAGPKRKMPIKPGPAPAVAAAPAAAAAKMPAPAKIAAAPRKRPTPSMMSAAISSRPPAKKGTDTGLGDPPLRAPQEAAKRGSVADALVRGGNGANVDVTSMSGQLTELGLSQAQIDGVLALSKDVIERVVWEVVPTLAETLIREEIKRLTAK